MFTNDMFSGMVTALILVGMALAVVLAGIAWLVWHGWSAWWFLLAVGLLANYSNKQDDTAPDGLEGE